MPDLPPAMRSEGREADQEFDPDEYLYRRVPLDHWAEWDDYIELDAIELPDMSVMRSKYAHPEWARFEGADYKYDDWGVIGFRVEDIPTPLQHLGVFLCTFGAFHVPLRRNYPHSEVRAYEDAKHIDVSSKLDHDLHMRWRERLARHVKKFIGPKEDVEVRQNAPQAI
jgi:hypothetical protein